MPLHTGQAAGPTAVTLQRLEGDQEQWIDWSQTFVFRSAHSSQESVGLLRFCFGLILSSVASLLAVVGDAAMDESTSDKGGRAMSWPV